MDKVYYCFPGGKFKVLTMSYDDGKQEDRRLVSIFNQYGIKGTFHLNYGLMDQDIRINKEEIKELYKGHEVSAHTYTHPTIARCPSEMIVEQVMEDRKGLESIVGYPIRGLSYPNGSYNDKIKELLPHLGIRYARIVGNSDWFDMPKDFLEWKATCHHNHDLLELGKQFVELTKKQYLYMMYVWGHSYEFSRDNNWEVMEEFCKMIGNRDDIWYATNIQIVDYMDVIERLQFSAKGDIVYNPSAASAWLVVNDEKYVEVKGGQTVQLF
ncbi:MAG: polysaccharide deacetylase [Lachnospiraceae bacterium]|nr:polysaccharide deacetylase [Lachnospiraceae bacterium]